MNDERDPLLERWFNEVDDVEVDEAFTTTVMDRVTAHRRRVMGIRFGILALVVILELLLDSPLEASVGFLSSALATNIYPVDNEWLGFIVSPINSAAGVLGLMLLALHTFYRRYVR